MHAPKVRIIIVTGYPRSGTTLLARILSQATRGVAVGELFDQIQTNPETSVCGCGQRFAECKFWSPVIQATLGGWDEEYFTRFRRLAQSVGRAKHLPQLVCSGLRSPEYCTRMEEILLILGKLYQKIQAASERSVIVESSKSPAFPMLLGQNATLDVRVVQLIRDSRAVSYSVLKRNNTPGSSVTDRIIPLDDFARVAREWTTYNLVFELEGMLAKNWLRIRYEQFVTDPIKIVRGVLSRLGETGPDLSGFAGSNTVNLHENHIVGGNRNRFEIGNQSIQLDNEWRTMMSWREKALVTFITLPVLLRHRYPLIVSA